jgi:threonylcarbamoyladenosine tRNA methylthiotransferase MtaB
MFENSLALIARLRHRPRPHIFPYSPRAGTPAARMPQVSREVVKARAATLRTACAETSAPLAAKPGGQQPASAGRAPGPHAAMPAISPKCVFVTTRRLEVGDIVTVKIHAVRDGKLIA